MCLIIFQDLQNHINRIFRGEILIQKCLDVRVTFFSYTYSMHMSQFKLLLLIQSNCSYIENIILY